MPSYRFCRPDDIPFLVRAVNECYAVHFPGMAPMTVEGFRREMKELDLWASSCLVAAADERPVAVLTGTKREDETLISRLGVRPGELRRGHGGHLVTSLSQKLAVLGPPRLVAEVPAELPGAVAFFERLGWRREASFRDWLRPAATGAVEPVPEGLIAPATPDQLAAAGVLEAPPGAAWLRTRKTLVNRKDGLRAAAVASPDRIEAWLVFDPEGEPRSTAGPAVEGLGLGPAEEAAARVEDRPVDVVGSWAADEHRRELLLGALLRHLIAEVPARPVRLVRLAARELPEGLLAGLGFAPDREYHRHAAEAKPL
jgi:GNAT superfamily N-acetyltransferase